jgi:hypothetical protein
MNAEYKPVAENPVSFIVTIVPDIKKVAFTVKTKTELVIC